MTVIGGLRALLLAEQWLCSRYRAEQVVLPHDHSSVHLRRANVLTHTQGRQQQFGVLRIEKIQVLHVNAVVVDGFLVVPVEF